MNTFQQLDTFLINKFNPSTYDFESCVLDNLDISFFQFQDFLADEDESLSIISFLFYNGREFNKLAPALKEFFDNLSLKDAAVLSAEEAYSILNIFYYGIRDLFPDIFDLFDYEFTVNVYGRNVASDFKLKDPFYTFPELDRARQLQKLFKLSNNQLLLALEADFSDFATYAIGDWNGDLQEEYMEYFEDFLKPAILAGEKDLDIYNQIVELESFARTVTECSQSLSDLDQIDCTSSSSMQRTVSSMKHEIESKLNNIPSKYRDTTVIHDKINSLRLDIVSIHSVVQKI